MTRYTAYPPSRELKTLGATNGSARAWALVLAWAMAFGALRPLSAQNAFLQHNLVANVAGLADQTDPRLVYPWGIAASPAGPFWVCDNHAGLSTLYNGAGAVRSLVVTIPSSGGSSSVAAPSGIIFNSITNFSVVSNTPAQFLFATGDGTLSAWGSGGNAVLKVDHSAAGAVYTGLAPGSSGGSNYLYAADFHGARIEVFDDAFMDRSAAFSFNDSSIPAGFAPFNIQNLNGALYVVFARQDAAGRNPVPGAGNGYVDVFDTGGQLVKRLVVSGPLNAPWGLAMAPAGFGSFGGDLLVGNFGDGEINVFDPSTGAWRGALRTPAGNTMSIPGLLGLVFGNGGEGGDTNSLYFTAGIATGGTFGNQGLLGRISVLTGVYLTNLKVDGNSLTVSWAGGTPPYLVATKTGLSDTNWRDAITTALRAIIVAGDAGRGFVRVSDRAPLTAVPLTVSLSGLAEIPPVTTAASGLGALALEGNTLTYHITYSGLSAPVLGAHLRGPATSTQQAGAIAPLGPVADGTSGTIDGAVDLTTWTSAQLTALKSGKTYVEISTSANTAGEIRGQIAPVQFSAYLTGASEVPPVNTPGWGTAACSLIGNQLNCTLTWTNLLGAAVTAHIHGPASPTNTAVVLVPLPAVSGTSGHVTASFLLTPDRLGLLIDVVNAGLAYVNVHSLTNLTGELRGQVMP
jgi:uncharacterized protein (TIGR03118 family)